MPDTAQSILNRPTEKLAKALPGDPHANRIVKQSFKGTLEEFITR